MTMTIEHDTITTTSAMMQPQVLASIQSLIVFAEPSRNAITPVITGLRATRTGETQLTVVVTNRFVAAKATYDNIEFSNWDKDPQFWLDPVMLKQAATVSKADGLSMVSIGYDSDTKDSFISIGDTRFTYRQLTAGYPPVDRLFNDMAARNGAADIQLKLQWLVALSKVVTPEPKQDKERPWLFQFATAENPTKPEPVLASVNGQEYTISVLIQPNLIVR